MCSILEIFYYFKYKHFLFLFRVFSNCFISPNFIWRRYNIMRSLAAGEAFMTFILPGTKCTQMPNFLVQRSVLVWLSRGHMKQGYLGYPPCWPKKKNAKRNMRQLCSMYFILNVQWTNSTFYFHYIRAHIQDYNPTNQ